MKRVVGVIAGVLVAAMGLIWTLQGLNSTLAPQSFMTGSPLWVVLGLVTIGLGITVAVWSWRRSPR